MFTNKKSNRIAALLLTLSLTVGVFASQTLTVHATAESLRDAAEARKQLPIQTNEIDNWPTGPEIGAEAAILMDVDTGVILYAKNIHERLYPASTTKIFTCLLAMQRGNLDDMVTFSKEAVFSVPYDGSNMGMDVGQAITLEDCLYGILVGSANEVANAVGEYISGSISAFTDLMNEEAAAIGCTDSHFVNTNGLFDENHYTSAYDLALISRLFFQNEMLCKIGNTTRKHFEPTATQPDDFYLRNKHKLINGEMEYEGIVGGKTGYTDQSRQTLVTCAERDGMRLVCVVFKEESPNQFNDTIALFDYGFDNFNNTNISEKETKFDMDTAGFLQTGNDIFGSSKPILSIDTDSHVIIPNTITFDDLQYSIEYGDFSDNAIAKINYTYNDNYVGCAYVELIDNKVPVYKFDTNVSATNTQIDKPENKEEKTIFVNVKKVLLSILILAIIVILLFIARAFIINNRSSRRRRNKIRRRQINNRIRNRRAYSSTRKRPRSKELHF